MSRKKLIFNRNKKQLKKIIEWRIHERRNIYHQKDPTSSDFNEMKVLQGKIDVLYWVLEVLDNPKKWDNDFEFEPDIFDDDEMFKEMN